MSQRLLDTNIWIAFLRGDPDVRRHLAGQHPGSIVSCSVVRAELFFGAYKSQRAELNLAAFEEMLSPFRSLPFDDFACDHYGRIRSTLERAGTPIGGNDLLIAAIALANDCVLVTRNTREFVRVPGLKLDSWK